MVSLYISSYRQESVEEGIDIFLRSNQLDIYQCDFINLGFDSRKKVLSPRTSPFPVTIGNILYTVTVSLYVAYVSSFTAIYIIEHRLRQMHGIFNNHLVPDRNKRFGISSKPGGFPADNDQQYFSQHNSSPDSNMSLL